MSVEVAQSDLAERLHVACMRIASLSSALERARPYVHVHAQNAPRDDGGEEAVADLLVIDAALAEAGQ